MSNNLGDSALIGFVLGIVLMFFIMVANEPIPEKQPQIKPCNCLNYFEWQILSTKRDMLLDKRKHSKKDSTSLDSINVALGVYK